MQAEWAYEAGANPEGVSPPVLPWEKLTPGQALF